VSIVSLGKYFGVDGKQLQKQYKDHLSDFWDWNQREHAEEYILFPKNMGEHLSIDETALIDGELFTILTNKAGKGRQGSLVAIIKGTDGKVVSDVLMKMEAKVLFAVKTVTMDMANSMDWIVRNCFSNSMKIIDRFHVEKLVSEAVQDLRIEYRWKALDEENTLIQQARKDKTQYQSHRYENGDTRKQLLARSRYILFKTENKWTESQKQRAEILFKEYPQLKEAYDLAMKFKYIYQTSTTQEKAKERLQQWYEQVKASNIGYLQTAAETIRSHESNILNYFPDKRTNASAESFNAKLKAFKSLLRGITDISFFLFRIYKIYA
jgi:transposase